MNRDPLQLPPLRTRLAEAWPFAVAWLGMLVGPFVVFPLGEALLGWLLGAVLYLLVRLLSQRPLFDHLSDDPEFGLDEQGRVHVLSNEKVAFTPIGEWSGKHETGAALVPVVKGILFLIVITASFVMAAERWNEAIAMSAFAGFMIVLSVAEPLQQVRGRRSFRQAEGRVILNPTVFGGFFRRYVESSRFDPNNRTPHIDIVLDAALEHVDPARRAEILVKAREDMVARGHGKIALGAFGKILRIFGG